MDKSNKIHNLFHIHAIPSHQSLISKRTGKSYTIEVKDNPIDWDLAYSSIINEDSKYPDKSTRE